MPPFVNSALSWSFAVAVTVLAVWAGGHALLNKREPRAAWAWIAVCLLFPVAGPFLYYLLGINRVRSRALELQEQAPFELDSWAPPGDEAAPPQEYRELARIARGITGRPLVSGNALTALHHGEEAYPAMLRAIDAAEQSVFLSTYIFETNQWGRTFIDALARAHGRGCDVRVLVDGVGELYSRPRASTLLRRAGVHCARFLPPRLFPPELSVNLRTHQKILAVDGKVGFTGGMNLGDRHLYHATGNPDRVGDMHFRLEGPIVTQLEEVFLWGWGFATREETTPPEPRAEAAGDSVCRTVVSGPDEHLDRLTSILAAAMAAASERICIMTPYLLPPRDLISAMQGAALRGVDVRVVLPEKNNLPYIHRATRNMLWELLQWGVRVAYQPPPFAHTKLFMVDGRYAQLGSANLDARSLRLNFEMVVEVFDKDFVQGLAQDFDATWERSRPVSLQEVDSRSLPTRLADSLFWLFAPYL